MSTAMNGIDAFPSDLSEAYTHFRGDLARVFAEAGIDGTSGSAIATSLGLNRQLAWQLAKIVAEPRTTQGLEVLPGARGLKLLTKSCTQRLEASGSLGRLETSLSELEDAVERNVGDRSSLSLLTASWDPSQLESRTEVFRREGYRARCALLGAQVATQVRGIIYAPSPSGDPEKLCVATYHCFAGLMRLRQRQDLRLLYLEAPTHDDGSMLIDRQELERHFQEKFQLDERLSSGTADEIEFVLDDRRGWIVLKPGTIGRAGLSHWSFTGSVRHENERFRTERDRTAGFVIQTNVPAETVSIDCFMHKSLAESAWTLRSLKARCFDASSPLPIAPNLTVDHPAYLYDLSEHTPLGSAELASDRSVPHITDVIDQAAARVNCRVDDLVGVRFRTRYVMTPTVFTIEHELPDRAQVLH